MKEEERTDKLTSIVGNVGASSTFSISKQGGEAMVLAMLRDKIYSNKILAFIREYSTNAYDAHISVGKKDLPILITYPSSSDHFFRVRDFGPGLSEEDIYNIYIKYAASTKKTSNDYNGQMGLGSKSAFAYSNSWQITSYYNGTRKVFAAYIDESNLGACTLLDASPCDAESTGIEICIPIQSKDIYEVKKEGDVFYHWFNGPVNYQIGFDGQINNYSRTYKNHSTYISSDGKYIVSNGSGFQSSKLYALMGGVRYKITTSISDISYAIAGMQLLPNDYKELTIHFPIGSLAVSTSREALEYTPKTIKSCVDEISALSNNIFTDAKNKVQHLSTYEGWRKAKKLLKDWGFSSVKVPDKLFPNIPQFIKLNIFSKTAVEYGIDISQTKLKAMPFAVNKNSDYKSNHLSIDLSTSSLIIADEPKKIAVGKAKKIFAEQSEAPFSYAIILFGDKDEIINTLNNEGISNDVWRLSSSIKIDNAQLNNEDDIDISSVIPYKMDVSKRKSILYKPAKEYLYTSAKSKNWESYSYDSSRPTFYFEIKNFAINTNNEIVSDYEIIRDLEKDTKTLISIGVLPAEAIIVGVRSKDVHLAEKMGCISLTTILNEKYKEMGNSVADILFASCINTCTHEFIDIFKAKGWFAPIRTNVSLSKEEDLKYGKFSSLKRSKLGKAFITLEELDNVLNLQKKVYGFIEIVKNRSEILNSIHDKYMPDLLRKRIISHELDLLAGQIPIMGQMSFEF